ncbi:MAG: hypothetical protein Q4A17_09845 [Thermoguttaceae bacterium]|nr:hypothetical protein [Thermoguttaceae bacterium]
MSLNPAIRTSWLWLVLTILADLSFGFGCVTKNYLWVIVALPILFLVFPLSALAALSELSPQSLSEPGAKSWVKSRKVLNKCFFLGIICAVFFLSPYHARSETVWLFVFMAIVTSEVWLLIATRQIFAKFREKCVACALWTQYLAGLPILFSLCYIFWEILS